MVSSKGAMAQCQVKSCGTGASKAVWHRCLVKSYGMGVE